jgi:signal transduction histidine kinase
MKDRLAGALRAALYQLLGAALLTPVAAPLAVVLLGEFSLTRVLVLWAACLPASVVVASVPLIRRIEAIAVSELLEVDVRDRADRLYLWVLTTLHLFIGATLSALVLAVLPGIHRPGVETAPLIVGAVVVMVAAGSVQQWATRRLLRSDPSHLIEDLGRRQSLALELHDSVGHAFSVVLVQAMAAQAALQKQDAAEEVGRSLDHVTTIARDAQQDLDVLLSVLDEVECPTLASLHDLTRGLDVKCRADPVDRVPERISRAAYAIAREAITNALRHGRGRVMLDVAIGSELVLTVANQVGPMAGAREGRGLAGMRMRARLVGGTFEGTEVDGTWRTRATLPL